MKCEQFEALIVKLWLSTRIPLTQLNLQYLSGLSRKKLDRYLTELTVTDVLVSAIDTNGEIVWSMPGAARSAIGPRTVAEYSKVEELSPNKSHALVKSGMGKSQALAPTDSKKSVVLSGLLSFLFGPLGWLYAGSFREALPAFGATVLASAILPSFLLTPLLGVLGPVSAIAGVLYAMQYNRNGERTPLLSDDKSKQLKG